MERLNILKVDNIIFIMINSAEKNKRVDLLRVLKTQLTVLKTRRILFKIRIQIFNDFKK